jgi:hypothetical protein
MFPILLLEDNFEENLDFRNYKKQINKLEDTYRKQSHLLLFNLSQQN